MPINRRTSFVVTSGTSVGSAYAVGIKDPFDRPVAFQLDMSSADVTIQGTNFFDLEADPTDVGSLWSNVTSGENLAASGLYVIDVSGAVFAAYRVLVNSVAGHVTAAFIQ